MKNYGSREPTPQELQKDVDRLLGALDAPMNTGLPGSGARSPNGFPGSGARSPHAFGSGARSPFDSLNSAEMRSPVTGGYGSGTRTPNPVSYSTPGERFAAPMSRDPPRLPHMESVMQTLEGRSPMPGDEARSGWRGSHDAPSSSGDTDGGFYREFQSQNFPEQSNLVVPPMDEDDDRHHGVDDHPASQASIKQLHDEMDALLADSSATQLTPDQQMLLRQNEISNRAQMEAFRVPVTASIDRVMQRDNRMQMGPDNMIQPMQPGMMPPQRKPDDSDLGFGFRCFRACS